MTNTTHNQPQDKGIDNENKKALDLLQHCLFVDKYDLEIFSLEVEANHDKRTVSLKPNKEALTKAKEQERSEWYEISPREFAERFTQQGEDHAIRALRHVLKTKTDSKVAQAIEEDLRQALSTPNPQETNN